MTDTTAPVPAPIPPLNERSKRNLAGVHPHLVAIVEKAALKQPFLVTEGIRTRERQKMLVQAGKSKTLNSRHLTGHAIDLCDTDGCYDIADMRAIASAMKDAAKELGTPLEWGGDWKKFCDTPHFQLPWKQYPKSGATVADKAKEAVKKKSVVAAVATAVTAAADPVNTIPAAPAILTQSVQNFASWQTVGDAATAAAGAPLFYHAAAVVAAYLVVCHLVPRWAEGRQT